MLIPRRVKHRKQHHPKRSGMSKGGNRVTFGEYGIQALEPAYVTNRQIESARIAMTRHIKRGGKVWIYKGDELMTREEQAAQAALRARDQRARRPRSNTPRTSNPARDGGTPTQPVATETAAPEPVETAVTTEAAAPEATATESTPTTEES